TLEHNLIWQALNETFIYGTKYDVEHTQFFSFFSLFAKIKSKFKRTTILSVTTSLTAFGESKFGQVQKKRNYKTIMLGFMVNAAIHVLRKNKPRLDITGVSIIENSLFLAAKTYFR
ncbi:hypothetical protein ACJX0J_035068, partial [Zea mays]